MFDILSNVNELYCDLDHCGVHMDCKECMRNEYYEEPDTYDCAKKLCCYVMNYGPALASEIYHYLAQSRVLDNEYNHNRIRILSLGCGFSPELYAIDKYIEENQLDINYDYVGYDLEDNWNLIREHRIYKRYETRDILDGFDTEDYDIIFMLKVFSTIRRNNIDAEREFLNVLCDGIDTMKEGSHLIFNDINHRDFGRDVIDRRISPLFENIDRYYFPVENAYRGNFIMINETGNVFDCPDSLEYTPKTYVHKSIIFDYRK